MTVIQFDGITKVREPAEQLLEKAKGWQCEDVVVIGCAEDGSVQIGANTSDCERAVWLLNAALHYFMKDFWESPPEPTGV